MKGEGQEQAQLGVLLGKGTCPPCRVGCNPIPCLLGIDRGEGHMPQGIARMSVQADKALGAYETGLPERCRTQCVAKGPCSRERVQQQ